MSPRSDDNVRFREIPEQSALGRWKVQNDLFAELEAEKAKVMALKGSLGRVREFVENEAENRDAAGALMSDYENEAKDALAEIDRMLVVLEGDKARPFCGSRAAVNEKRDQIAAIIRQHVHGRTIETYNSQGALVLTPGLGVDGVERAADAILALRSGGEGWRPAIADIAAERRRQIDVEGRTPEHDDSYPIGTLARAAACYAWSGHSVHPIFRKRMADAAFDHADDLAPVKHMWPWDWTWWKPKNPRRDLIRAAALIVAEIERLDRASPSTHGDGA